MPMNHNHCKYSQTLLLLLLEVKGPLLDCAVKFYFAFNSVISTVLIKILNPVNLGKNLP